MPPTDNFRNTPTNYISSKREFIGESKSFKISGKYFDFAILRAWRCQVYNLFCKYINFLGVTKAFWNFAKYIITFIFAKFKYFAKQIIYLESPDHVLQNDI